MSGFRSVSEAMDVAATLGLNDLSRDAGWEPRHDVTSNAQVNMRRDGSVTATLRYVLPKDRAEALLATLRDPKREPSTIGALIRDAQEATR